MNNNEPLLKIMIEDQSFQDNLYRPGPYWQPYQDRIVQAIFDDGLNNFRSNVKIMKGFGAVYSTDPENYWIPNRIQTKIKKFLMKVPPFNKVFHEYKTALASSVNRGRQLDIACYGLEYGAWLRKVRSQYDFPVTTNGGCVDVLNLDGWEISIGYANQFMRIFNCEKEADFKKISSMFEIGGGFGAHAHMMVHMNPNIRKYLYVDIPPMLYVATQYLKNFFGDNVIDYNRTRLLEEIKFNDNDELEIVCIPPWQLKNFRGSIDSFWNAASFSEMSSEIVENYGNLMSRLLNPNGNRVFVFANQPTKTETTLLPEEVLSALGESFSFRQITPEIENSKIRYYVGECRS